MEIKFSGLIELAKEKKNARITEVCNTDTKSMLQVLTILKPLYEGHEEVSAKEGNGISGNNYLKQRNSH